MVQGASPRAVNPTPPMVLVVAMALLIPALSASCDGVSCSGHGTAYANVHGISGCACKCDMGYKGSCCSECVNSYYLSWSTCLPCTDASMCSSHGTASVKHRWNCQCVCDFGYGNVDCSSCHYYKRPGSNECEICSKDACNGNGRLYSDKIRDGRYYCECRCFHNYHGTYCNICTSKSWFHSSHHTCSSHGSVKLSYGGFAVYNCGCNCQVGYTGSTCTDCANKYPRGSGGTCMVTTGDYCSHHGAFVLYFHDYGWIYTQPTVCVGSSVILECVRLAKIHSTAHRQYSYYGCRCHSGYRGEHCAECVASASRIGNTCTICTNSFTCNSRGTASISNGGCWCTCHAGYNGEGCTYLGSATGACGGFETTLTPPSSLQTEGSIAAPLQTEWFFTGAVVAGGIGVVTGIFTLALTARSVYRSRRPKSTVVA